MGAVYEYICGNYEADLEAAPKASATLAKFMKLAGQVVGMVGKLALGMDNTSGVRTSSASMITMATWVLSRPAIFIRGSFGKTGNGTLCSDNPFTCVLKAIPATAPAAMIEAYKGKEYALTKLVEKTLDFIRKN